MSIGEKWIKVMLRRRNYVIISNNNIYRSLRFKIQFRDEMEGNSES